MSKTVLGNEEHSEDHIFTSTSVLRKRLSDGKNTFCTFIDMQKTFDCIDLDMLFYKLLNYIITSNICRCIKAIL